MTQPQTKTCQNCESEFTIEPEDFDFYEKIQVPPPTFCSKCRLQRRLAWFNLINLYKRKCDLCGEEKISMYSPEAPYKVYCPTCWWGDAWNPYEYGKEYDFSRSFFEQFRELLHEAPLLGLSVDLNSSIGSDYNNYMGHLKNCYLLFWADFNEEANHGFYVYHNKNLVDCSLLRSCEFCYGLTYAYKSNRCIDSKDAIELINCSFMRDSFNCQNCFGSANLRNKKHYIFNKSYTKEEYFEEIKKWDLGSYKDYQAAKKLSKENWKKFPPMPVFEDFTINCTGDRIFNSKNCKDCFEVNGAENCKYIWMMGDPPTKECYDISGWGNNLALSYDCGVVGENSSELRFCHDSGMNLYHAEYCKLAFGGSYQFGCVSVKKGNYCILNKQYKESEFWELREKIIKHMNEKPFIDKCGKVYRYGEFFPTELSPHAYNETIASKFFPLSQNEAITSGYGWRDPDIREYTITKKVENLPDHIKNVDENILREVIGCVVCSKGFKVTKFELDFLKKMNLPLPHKCPFCRINEKLDFWVKGFNLVKRICDECGAEFNSQHTKEEIDYILCKKCYLQKVV